ncbi:MAG: type IV secretion system DNA-binding domain-containing protein [Synergistaceae bacterium]|nr:type IV secretion system DNA-binding domain-containing protein [Synergistaceae bacterium]
MSLRQEALRGSLLSENFPPKCTNVGVVLRDSSGKSAFCLDEKTLCKHVLLIGSTGTGKTNLFYHIVKQIKSNMSVDDVMLIFDSKGDFHSKFFSSGDVVIGNSAQYRKFSQRWSIYNEITADSRDEISQNTREICKYLFAKRIEKNNNNPFFPNAASDVMFGIIMSLIYTGKKFSNSQLRDFIDTATLAELAANFAKHRDLQSITTYIDPKASQQALGVLAEMYSVAREVLVGVFAGVGEFSMRKFIRDKNARTAFLEYDLAIGDVLAPVYSMMFDLALKEALGRTTTRGNVYLIADELKLLPNLRHLDDGINFGRGLGVKILAGLQGIDQLKANYDNEAKAHNAIAGFSTLIAFRAGDFATREYISNALGKNFLLETIQEADGTRRTEKRQALIVEDWDLLDLATGEAIVKLPESPPFKFHFSEYK